MRIGADFIYYIVFQIDRLSIRHRKLAIILVAVRQGEVDDVIPGVGDVELQAIRRKARVGLHIASSEFAIRWCRIWGFAIPFSMPTIFKPSPFAAKMVVSVKLVTISH